MDTRKPLFETLDELLAEHGPITVEDLVEVAGEQTAGLLVLLLALPSLVPVVDVPAAPFGGAAIVGLGWRMARGAATPWLPERIRTLELRKGRVKETLARVERVMTRLGLDRLERRPLPQRWMGALLVWTGLLLAIPIPLPLGNIFPAATLAILGIALLEERPGLAWIGALASLGVTLYFALSAELIVHELRRGFSRLGAWLA